MFKVFTRLSRMVRNLRTILSDGLSLFAAISRRRTAVAAENLFLRKQLALFRERRRKRCPRRPPTGLYFPNWLVRLALVQTLLGMRSASRNDRAPRQAARIAAQISGAVLGLPDNFPVLN